MTFSIRLSPKAAKALEKLPEETASRIRDKLIAIRDEPFSYIKRLKGIGAYSLRIGDYRAIIDVEDELLLVRIIDHRKRVYR